MVNAGYALRRVWEFSKPMFFVYSFGAVVEAGGPILQAYIAGSVLGELAQIPSGGASQSRLVTLIAIAALAQLVYMLVSSLKQYYFDTKREYMELELNHELLTVQSNMKLEELELPEIREKFEYAKSGINEIFWYVRAVMDLLSAFLSILGTIFVVVSTVPLAAAVLVLLPVGTVYMNYRNYLANRNLWDSKRPHRIRAFSIERILSTENGILEVRLYGLLSKLIKMWRHESVLSIEVVRHQQTVNTRANIITQIVESSIGVAVDIWLVVQVFASAITVSIFEQTRRLVSNYILSLSRVGSSLSDVVLYGVKINDYRTFTVTTPTEKPEPIDSAPLGVLESISLDAVDFSYPNSKNLALENVGVALNRGESLAIIGENGAGKTTLLKILLGAYSRKKGSLKINDNEATLYQIAELYKNAATLFQDFQTYDFLTLGESIALMGSSYDEERIERVLRQVGMWDFVNKQPKGLNSNLGYVEEDGIKLSGGQWQRLAIARALYKDSEIMILDEPTSAIDARSEQDIMDLIFEGHKNKLLLIVSHRLSTVRRADKIVVLKAGKIVESGNHESLFKKGTEYYDLFHKQSIHINSKKED